MSTTTPVFSASGLASGLDTNSIVSQLVQIAQQPLNNLQQQQSDYQAQISQLGTLASKLSDLQSAADALAKNGVVGVQTTSANTTFSAVASPQAQPGSHSIQVTGIASAALARSQAFSSNTAPVKGGTLQLSVQGTSYPAITISDGEALSDVANAINQSGAPVTASIISDGTYSYLNVANNDTGYTIGQDPSTALSITENSTGTQGQALTASIVSPATNAQLVVDNLTINRTSNTVSDVISGVTLTLKSKGSAENLSMASDTNQTAQNLQDFVNAYNAIVNVLNQNINISSTTDRNTTLAGDYSVLGLQSQLQALTTTVVPGLSVSSLAQLGLKTNQDGTLSIDTKALSTALSTSPSSMNALFSTANTGIDAAIQNITTTFADPVTGLFTQEQSSLQDNIRTLTDQQNQMQEQLDQYRQGLVAQFSAMEQVVSGFKSAASFLTQQSSSSSSSGG